MSAQDLLFSDEFSSYREKEIESCVDMMAGLFKTDMNPDFIKGGMKMLENVLNLPAALAGTNEAKQRASDMIRRDFKRFEMRFIKKFLDFE